MRISQASHKREVGWIGGKLYDVGLPAVRTALASGHPHPAATEITPGTWNHPRWIEPPISHR